MIFEDGAEGVEKDVNEWIKVMIPAGAPTAGARWEMGSFLWIERVGREGSPWVSTGAGGVADAWATGR